MSWFLIIAALVILLAENPSPPNEVGYALLAAGTLLLVVAIWRGGDD